MDNGPEKDGQSRNLEAWQADFEAQMKLPLSQCAWQSPEGISVSPLYTSDSVKTQPGFPGQPPYTRGVQASGYVGRPWTIRQYAGFSTAQASNAFYKANLDAGQQGISVAFDLPTHRGYDSDHERVSGDVGKAGVAVDSIVDMKTLFDGIPLQETSVSMTMNGAVLPVLAFYIVAAQEQGVGLNALRGTIQNDILKEFMVRNTFIYPPKPSMDIVSHIIGFSAQHMPKFNPISISGYHMQEAGAPAALELAYTLANGRTYVEKAMSFGLELDQFAPRLSFFFGIGMNFLMEVAKLRAARRLWAEIMTDLGAKNPKSMLMRCHCQTSGWSLTAQDPYNNVVRTTVEAMAAVLGGTQSLHTNAFDEAVALPSVASARLARNTQLILQLETDLLTSVDPFGGSYMIESLTDELCQKVYGIWSDLDAAGGMVSAIEQGVPQYEIAKAAAQRQAAIDRQEQPVVGVNCYETRTDQDFEITNVDTASVLAVQQAQLVELKQRRDQLQVNETLAALQQVASTEKGNLLEKAIAAARARATLGEISEALESVYGRYQGRVIQVKGVFEKAYIKDARWQTLQKKIIGFHQRQGRRPRILVGKLGQDGHDRGAKVIAAGFVDLGFDVDLSPLFTTPEEVLRLAIDQDVHVIGISTLAGAHTTLVPRLMEQIRLEGLSLSVVVGGVIPEQDHQLLIDSGVAYIATPGTSVIEAAETVLQALESAGL